MLLWNSQIRFVREVERREVRELMLGRNVGAVVLESNSAGSFVGAVSTAACEQSNPPKISQSLFRYLTRHIEAAARLLHGPEMFSRPFSLTTSFQSEKRRK